jgi:hypothetical protein
MVIILLVSPSCKSVDPSLYTIHCDSVAYTTHQSVDTIVMRDSVFISERQRGDTIYLTRTEWRDRWRTQIVHDTIRNTEYITQTIESPPQRYVPKFYKTSTILFYLSLLIMAVIIFIKLKLK